MITFNLSGGLGNQMFQYAAAYALARRLDVMLALDLSEFAHYDLRAYMLDGYAISKDVVVAKNNPSKWWRRIQKMLPSSKYYNEPHYHFDPKFLTLKDGSKIEGYFQSEKYFAEIADDIRTQFSLVEKLSKNAENIKNKIKKSPIAVSLHVRRGDYISDAKTQQVHGSASENYYKAAVKAITEKTDGDITFFIFSDDPDYARANFDFCAHKYIVEGNDDRPHEDMYLMSKCDHHILANSSFSWWGAWLNPSEDKTVIAPKLWFSKETLQTKSLADLFPPQWITL